ncbi:PAS domain S-box protein [Halorussus sp. MSC15.2]|uniref:PAS domain S-box protein n=1 Tax=Halorussus sp. MSC15.2 TaxID=2283638 RepID=UPI0013D176B3|nr:PAS domain S-box protein [Halorussus sp. MSC15.2]NEU56703.1 PAS domain S-box protein [Halorussus sp. MSC15.2]
MSGRVRVLYVTPRRVVGRLLESLFAAERPDVSFSFVTGVDAARTAVRAERIDRVVLDPAVGGPESASELRRENSDVRVTTIANTGVGRPPDGTGGQLPRGEPDPVRALSRRIEDAAAPGAVTDGGVETDHFYALAEELSDGVIVIDTDSVVQFANPAVEEIFGYSPDELVGESLTKLMSDDLAERHREGIESYLRDGERHVDWNYLELTGRHRDGSDVVLSVSFSEHAVDDEVLFTGVVRDISDRKRRESELHDRIRQQRALSTFSRHALGDEPLDDLMDEAVELVAEALGQEYAGVLEYRPDSDDLLTRAVAGWPDDIVDSAAIGTERDSQAGYTLLTEDPVVTEDLTTEERFSRDELLESADATGGISALIGSPDDPWGVLGSHDPEPQSYADHDVQFVQSMAHILATVIQRRERERRLERSEAMLDAVGDGVYALDADSQFVAVNDAYVELTGYDREELLGEHASKVTGPSLYEDSKQIQAALEGGEDVVTTEVTLPTADGESIPVEVRITPLALGDETGRVGVVRDVSERKHREEKLTSLNEMFRSLADAETRTEICQCGVDTAVEVLGFPNAAVALYDDDANSLVPTVRRWDGEDIDDALLGSRAEGVAWQTFVESETKQYDELRSELDADAELQSALTVPLGKYGVFIAASPDRNAFDATDRSLADMLSSNLRSAFDRSEREETLREQRNDLQAKNRELERVNRLNSVIREITKALTQASSKEDVMQAVCSRLTESGPYRFAWFGTHDTATDEVRPEAWAGVEEGYLDTIDVNADSDEPEGRGPSGRAIRTREIQVQNDLLGDPPFDPWREQALKRGYRSSASVPVVYGGTLRGVLNLYAGEPGIFDELERAVLSELGETIGYALNALEQKQALVSERSVELDFRIRGTGNPILEFVDQTDAEFEFENAVQRSDGRLHVFFTIRDRSPEETLEFLRNIPWIESVRLVTERDDEYLYECALSDRSFLRSLMDRGAMPKTITATEGEGRFVIRLPQSADVRTFVDLFEDYYDDVDLVARREHDEPVMTRQDFESELDERLTERQAEVLRTAFFSGFFEWPRESTAEEIAEALGVSQPTVSRHIRGAERTLFGLLFEE